MTHEDFVDWLMTEVRAERMAAAEMEDLLRQKALFDRERDVLLAEFHNHVVGYAAEQRRFDRDIHALIDRAKAEHPGRMIYFEPIGFTLL